IITVQKAIDDNKFKHVSFNDFGEKTRIGRGGFGYVYTTTCTVFSEVVALKEIFFDIEDNEACIKRFLNE
ncbi:2017_t:CDS:1, partial [Dentiscutata erythropus]